MKFCKSLFVVFCIFEVFPTILFAQKDSRGSRILQAISSSILQTTELCSIPAAGRLKGCFVRADLRVAMCLVAAFGLQPRSA
jgi:hypothetical protein